MVKLKSIKANPANPRIIRDDKFHQLVASIEGFPRMLELKPIVVDENNMILAGNMRFRALQELKYKEIPDEWVRRAVDLTPEQKQEYIIKDNTHYGVWDIDMLANEWNQEEIASWGVDPAAWNMPAHSPATRDGGIGDQDEESYGTPGPRATDDDFSLFELVMLHDNKKLLLEELNQIKEKRQLEKLEDALMVLVKFYRLNANNE